MNNTSIFSSADETSSLDPASMVGKTVSFEEKSSVLKMQPCQPSELILSKRKKHICDRDHCCSQATFFHNDKHKSRRKLIAIQ